MATSAAYMLKKAYPKSNITMLVKPLNKSIVENNSVIDEVMLYDYTHKTKLDDIKKTARQIKAQNFDLAVVIDGKPRSAMLAWLAGIPTRAGFEHITLRNIYLKLFYTDLFKIDYDVMTVQQVKNHEIFINRLTGRNDKAKMVMPNVNLAGKKKVQYLLQKLPKGSMKIALCLRSGIQFKDWSMENFLKVIRTLDVKYKASFFIVGAKGDITYAEKFRQKSGLSNVYDFCGQTSLPELGYLLSCSDFMLSVDTGTAHIAAAANVPEVVIFAGTSHKHWAPYGSCVSTVYPQMQCYPCDDKTRKQCSCKADKFPCLKDIDVEKVISLCSKKIDSLKG